MIFTNHQIAYRNVASKVYRFSPEDIEVAIGDLQSILDSSGYELNGAVFFSIISDPTDEVMTAEIFLPIEESHFVNQTEEAVYFNSYFFIKPMLMTRIMDEFNEQSQVKYWELLDYIKRHDLNQKTPVFIEFKSSRAGQTYVEMSVGI